MKSNFYFANIGVRASVFLILSAFIEIFRRDNAKSKYRHKHVFEHEASEIIGLPSAVAVPANRSGVFILMAALKIGKGDEVIVTGFTCSAVSEPILELGATPVYADIETSTFCLDPNLLVSAITPRTRAIIIQHTFGFYGAIEQVIGIAKTHNLFVVEDCALAFGSRRNGRWLGTFGDASVWSFELSKTLSVGWGGLVGVNYDAQLAHRVRAISEGAGLQSRWSATQRLLQGGLSGLLYHHRMPGFFRRYVLGAMFKFRIFRRSADTPASDLRLPSDLQWKFLLRQLRRLDQILLNSKHAQHAYEAVLVGHGCQSESMRLGGADTVLVRFPMRVLNPRRFVDFFSANDIEVGRWFSSPVSSGAKSPTEYGYIAGICPLSEEVCSQIVNLPVHGRLTKSQINFIAATLDEYLRKFPEEVKFNKRIYLSNSSIVAC